MNESRVFGARYKLGELIGYGGMAEVHRGRDKRLNRDVAVKVLRADLARDQSFLHRFRREAHSAAGLNHPSIVSVYDTGEEQAPDGTEQPYIVMEYVDGRTLRDIVRSEGRLPARRAFEIVADVCAALDFSHRNGIVHRDIKPANVMITPSGAVKVMDFGIARAVADQGATMTQTSNVIGTAQYLSPEQARGEAVDARSDVYSTGCLLYELLTGGPPFQGDSPVAVAYQHVRENPALPSSRNADVPRAADSIVMKALAKNVANRYQTAAEMRQDIQRALANQPVLAEAVMTDAERTQFIARTPPPVAMPRRTDGYVDDGPDRRRSGLVWLAVALALLLVAGGIGWFIIANRASNGTAAKVVVPTDAIGRERAAAEDFLRDFKLVPVKGADTHGPCDNGKEVQKGQVCTLSPSPGREVVEGTTVTYQLYTPNTVQVPQVAGLDLTYAEAVQRLETVNLKAQRKDVNSQEKEGLVIRQSVEAYKPVAPGITIVLAVSTGKVKLPNLIGKKFDAAKLRLNTLGFNNITQPPLTQDTSDSTKDGVVVGQNLSKGVAYPLDTEITLTVYRYVAPVTSSAPSSPSSSCSSSSTATPPPGDGAAPTDTATAPPC